MSSGPRRPAGARNYLRWRPSIDEHLERRRLTWDECGMFNWLCTKADPRTSTLRTRWPTLAEQTTTLSANYVGKVCRSLKGKGYTAFPEHRGHHGSLVELAIDKFPLADGRYLRLARDAGRTSAEAPAELPADVLAEVPAELDTQKSTATGTSPGGRERKRETRDVDAPGVTPVRW